MIQNRRLFSIVWSSRCTYFHSTDSKQLKKIGKFTAPLVYGSYTTGQIFLHKKFGYRGVILKPWIGYLEYYLTTKQKEEGQEFSPRSRTFYHALVKEDDLTYAQVCLDYHMLQGTIDLDHTLLRMRRLCDDFVCHEDILPYIPCQNEPISKEGNKTSMTSKVMKRLLNGEHLRDLGSVYTRTTDGVCVSVTSQYMGKGLALTKKTHHCWCISVRLQNLRYSAVRLRYHYWGMMASTGEFYDTKGEGVCGSVVLLSHDRDVFQYRTWLCVDSPHVEVRGVFKAEVKEDIMFPVHIPQFSCQVSHP